MRKTKSDLRSAKGCCNLILYYGTFITDFQIHPLDSAKRLCGEKSSETQMNSPPAIKPEASLLCLQTLP
jgi:hypothetical protein